MRGQAVLWIAVMMWGAAGWVIAEAADQLSWIGLSCGVVAGGFAAHRLSTRRAQHTLIGTAIGVVVGWLFLKYQLRLWKLTDPELKAALFGSALGAGLSYWLSPIASTASKQRMINPFGATVSLLAIVLFLIPMTLTGSIKANFYTVPKVVRNQYRISCLFTHKSRSWDTVHYEVRREGELEWEEGPLEGYFDLDIFGYRSKLNRIVLASRRKTKDKKRLQYRNRIRLQEMGEYIASRWAELNPDDSPVRAVRIWRARHPVGGKHCMAREAWSRPPIEDIPEKHLSVVYTAMIKPAAGSTEGSLLKPSGSGETLRISPIHKGPRIIDRSIRSGKLPKPDGSETLPQKSAPALQRPDSKTVPEETSQ